MAVLPSLMQSRHPLASGDAQRWLLAQVPLPSFEAALAHRLGAVLVSSRPGRGTQLRAGVGVARGEWPMVLHADVSLDQAALRQAQGFLAGGCTGRFAVWPLRGRLLGVPYGDQGLIVHRLLYERAGGYPDIALMEDVAALVVLGPALDGGHYVLAISGMVPEVFSGMPWSTDRLLEATRARLEGEGVEWRELPTLRDADTMDDALARGLVPADRS